MAIEIERKFLVKGEFKLLATKSFYIKQGYLSSAQERTVRIRIKDDKGYITVKGMGNNSGTSRYEWEKEIPLTDANALLKICEPGVIAKTRYLVQVGKHTYEVDEFYADNAGLIIAEIELSSEEEFFIKPDWLGKEVTGDARYYNASLNQKPFCTW